MQKIDETWLKEYLNKLDNWFEEKSEFTAPQMDNRLHPYTHLFSPIQINQLLVKNRIVMGPMGNIYMAEESGRPSQKMIAFLTERAEGGVGLITTGLVPVGQGIDPGLTEVGNRSLFPRIDRSRTFFSGWHTLVQNIHSFGARIFIQLSPGAGRVGSPLPLLTKFQLPVSSSWNPNFYLPSVPCRPLLDAECKILVRRMAQAAADAKELGIDGVYIHGHEGYLLDQFTNRAFNHRWLSVYANWQSLGVEMVSTMRKQVGPHYPIMYRIGLSAALQAVYGDRIQKTAGLRRFQHERLIAETLQFMAELVKVGVDIFDVDLGVYDNWWLPHPPNSMPSACYLPISRLVKDFFTNNKIVSNQNQPVPIVTTGKLGYPDLAERALRENDCDMVMLARPLLADPSWAQKAYQGVCKEIRPCIADQEACLKSFVTGTHIQCAVNPRTGFEDVVPKILPTAQRKKKIVVVGAGPAGIQCALSACARGHHVVLYEKRKQVGGQMLPGCVPTIKYEVSNYLSYVENQLNHAQKSGGLELIKGTSFTPQDIKKGKYDVAVVAVGGTPLTPPLEGIEQKHVLQAIDVLMNPKLVSQAKNIVVVGGGTVGCEVAIWLAVEHQKHVSLIEMLPYLMQNTVTANRGHLLQLLRKKGVDVFNCTKLLRVSVDAISVSRNIHKSVPDPFNTWNPILPKNVQNPLEKKIKQKLIQESIPADAVILAVGLKPTTDFYAQCVQQQVAPEVHLIGDTFQTANIWEAVKAGFLLGKSL